MGAPSDACELMMPDRLPPVRRSLQTKAILAVTALVALSTSLAGYVTQRQATAAMEEALMRDIGFMAETAGQMVERTWANAKPQPRELDDLVRRLLRNGRISYIVVRDVTGRTLANGHNDARAWHEYQLQLSAHERASSLLLNRSIPLRGADGSLLMVRRQVITAPASPPSHPPTSTSTALGYVEIGMADPQLALLSNKLNQSTFVVVAASCIMCLPLVVWWVRGWTTPLRQMVGAALRLGLGQPSQVAMDRGDEIGLLGRAFNAMSLNLTAIQGALVEANAQLEQKVAVRTQQLEQANQQLKEAVKMLQEHASTDPLTGLANRRHIQSTLDRTFAEASRHGTDLACLMMDLDGFKSFNDTLGHLEGDRLLQTMARVLIANCRQSDVAGRYGGDEFVLLLPRTGPDLAQQVARRVMEQFSAAAAQMSPPELSCNVSVGIACVSMTRPASADQLVSRADKALYGAKQNGKARVHLYRLHDVRETTCDV